MAICWVILILVMEQKQKTRLQNMFRGIELPVIESLEIPDDYGSMDADLVGLIREGTEGWLAEGSRGKG